MLQNNVRSILVDSIRVGSSVGNQQMCGGVEDVQKYETNRQTTRYTRKRVVNERVELSQEFRAFKFTSPWETLELN